MPLRLQVVSAHREFMGGGNVQEFAACGGTIGRSLECDWPLPDSKRFISSRHAMIDHQAGAYYLVDLSRNGVFINGSDTPVGQGNPQRLFDGDHLRLGEFEIQVAVIDDPDEASDDGMRDSVVRAQMVQEDESVEVAMLAPDKIRDELRLEELLRPGDESGELSALSELPAGASAMLRKAVGQQILKDAVEEFLRSAGLNPSDFQGIGPQQLLQQAGALLSEFTEGTHSLLVTKDRISRQLNLHSKDTGKSASNPLRSADGVDNALRLLLGKQNNISKNGVAAVQAGFSELERHQNAIVAAMTSALGDYLGHFEPDAIEKQFGAQLPAAQRKDAFRELYAAAFQGLAHAHGRGLPQRFDEEFVRAYELALLD